MSSSSKRQSRAAALVALGVVVLYVFVTLVTVLPTTPIRGAIVSATSPFFSQKWNVFAPNIMKTNTEFVVQAQWRSDTGELVKSGWVSITEIEQNAVAGHPVPSRIQKSSWNAMLSYYSRYVELTDEQQDVVRDTFIERHDGGYRAKLPESLIEELGALGESQSDIVRFLRYDWMLKEYATNFATAYFDEKVERVRWQLQRTRPNDFDHRFDDAVQFDPYVVTFGWRHADDVIDPATIAVYDDVIERYEGAQ